jgi:Calcium binding
MKKPKKDPVRENRIHDEAIVDANGPEEQVMGWYYYLDDKIRFPFQAKCIAPKVVSPLRKGETVEVQRMAPEDACSADMLAGTVGPWQFPSHNWPPLIPTNPPLRPLATGITGWRRATASDPRRLRPYYAALPEAHDQALLDQTSQERHDAF